MAQNIVGSLPEFTQDASASERVLEEVKEAVADEETEEQTDTAELPAEKTADIPVGEDTTESPDPQALENQITGLQEERIKLLKEISELRGQRREIKQEQLQRVEQQIDDLKDVHPEDAALVERVLRAKGYITKEEAQHMSYEAIKQERLERFLDRYPEYKPENDPNDANWSALQKELGFYKMPSDPATIDAVLERAHRNVVKIPSDLTMPAKQRRVETASVGAGGAQRSSTPTKSLSPEHRQILKQGGWTDEEIGSIEQKLD